MPTLPGVRRPFVVASVMAATFMIAVEATIVSTAMPQIAAQLGDLQLYAWVFSGFLLAQTAMTVVFGKLADQYGRKPVLVVGILVFLIGSLLCGFAWSLPSLVLFRLVQGAGAGAIQPVCMTIIGDLHSVRERGRVQGWLASVWGVSSVIGPLAGGLIVQHLSWAWVFWINLPVGIAACLGLLAYLHETVGTERPDVDVAGAALFTAAVASLMTALTAVGTEDGRTAILAGAAFLASAVLFAWQERRASHPVVHFGLWARKPIATANAATLLSGMAIIGLTTFVPMYVQGVMERSALVAGFALTAMVLGWPVGATVAAKLFPRVGLRRTLLFGAALLPLGAFAFPMLGAAASPAVAGAGSLVMGLGMGFLSTSAIVIIQDCVGWAERGAATASNIFARNLGSTLGATVLGGVLNLSLSHGGGPGAAPGATPVHLDQVRQLLDRPGSSAGAAGGIADAALRAALGQSLHLTFWAVFAIAVATLVLAVRVPPVPIGAKTAAGD